MGKSMDKRANRIPVIDGLFDAGEEVRLLGSKCSECGSVFFPRRGYCRNPACSRDPLVDVRLSRQGQLHTLTVQHYMGPAPFKLDPALLPYTVVLVDLPEGVRVMGMLKEGLDPEKLRIGMPMEVTAGRLYEREDGAEVIVWKFQPAAT